MLFKLLNKLVKLQGVNKRVVTVHKAMPYTHLLISVAGKLRNINITQ